MKSAEQPAREHPRTLGWVGASALALGGSNQSLFVLGALVLSQGTAAIPLLALGLVLAWMAVPGWIELVLMWPKRVGGIAAVCAEAFRPYSPVLANLTGVCYWWGWVPTCGLTATLAAEAAHQAGLPVPVKFLAVALVLFFAVINLSGVRWATRAALALGAATGLLTTLAAVAPLWGHQVDWHRASSFSLQSPFHGVFGGVTSAMAGLYLIGFAAPAFEAATAHVGEMRDPVRSLPRAVKASGLTACVYFVVLPMIWLGSVGVPGLAHDQLSAAALGPTLGPVVGGAAHGVFTAFLIIALLHGTLQPLAGASRTMAQLAEDGLVPRVLERRNRNDTPWVATSLTAVAAIVFLLLGDPIWLIAAANLAYLIGIALPSVAVWLLRRHEPDRERPWRAPRGTIALGLVAAGGWLFSTVLGFEQYGLPTVLVGLALCYSCSLLYAGRRWSDRRRAGATSTYRSLHMRLTGAMLLVLTLDGLGYLLAVQRVDASDRPLTAVLSDVFVAVALLTISVGLVLPGSIGHGTTLVALAARRLSEGTVHDLTRAMQALGRGDLESARARIKFEPVEVRGRDEVRAMADAFNHVQAEVARAAVALDSARDELRRSRDELQAAAHQDQLTGLPNRRALELAISAMPLHNRSHALVLLDLDGFKDINDTRGHAAGDEVLRRVARVLTHRVAGGDVVARLGGDEFAVLLHDVDAVTAGAAAQGIIAAIREHATVVADGRRLRLSASAGVAVTNRSSTAAQLLMDADVAMYDAKERGRDRVSISDALDVGQAELKGRSGVLESIREALDQQRFTLVAQPIVDVATGTVARHELLLRMLSVDGELLSPASFLPAAERHGLIGAIDRMVVSMTLELLHSASAHGASAPVSFNVSGASVTDPAFLAVLSEGLRGLPEHVSRPVVELTETAAVVDIHAAKIFADALRALGCQMALDDFGAGYGSFHYLKQLPFDILKIDGAFVRDLPTSLEDRVLVRAIADVANRLGIHTVAEFVADDATMALLREYGVHAAQGYHLGKPLPLETAFPWLRAEVAARVPSPRQPVSSAGRPTISLA